MCVCWLMLLPPKYTPYYILLYYKTQQRTSKGDCGLFAWAGQAPSGGGLLPHTTLQATQPHVVVQHTPAPPTKHHLPRGGTLRVLLGCCATIVYTLPNDNRYHKMARLCPLGYNRLASTPPRFHAIFTSTCNVLNSLDTGQNRKIWQPQESDRTSAPPHTIPAAPALGEGPLACPPPRLQLQLRRCRACRSLARLPLAKRPPKTRTRWPSWSCTHRAPRLGGCGGGPVGAWEERVVVWVYVAPHLEM